MGAFNLLLMVAHFVTSIKAQGCLIDITELSHPQPVVMTAYTHKFLYPTAYDFFDTSLTIPRGEMILIACPGGDFIDFKSSLFYAACNNQDELVVDEQPISFSSIKCKNPDNGTLRITNQTCGANENSRVVEIGLNINPGFIFVPLVTVCFDFSKRNPVYANFTITKSLGIAPVHTMGAIQQDFDFYNLNLSITSLYDIKTSRQTINKLLGLDSMSEKYLKEPFHQEQLIRNEELFYESEARSVHHNLITWPQWRGCYVSDELHSAVFTYVMYNKIDLQVFTGTYGIATLPHEQTQKPVELHLFDDGKIKAVPVPAMLWRLVYEPISKRAVVLVGIDNANVTNVNDYILCEDISRYIDWVYFPRYCGISYACSYSDFRKAVPYLPNMEVVDLLL